MHAKFQHAVLAAITAATSTTANTAITTCTATMVWAPTCCASCTSHCCVQTSAIQTAQTNLPGLTQLQHTTSTRYNTEHWHLPVTWAAAAEPASSCCVKLMLPQGLRQVSSCPRCRCAAWFCCWCVPASQLDCRRKTRPQLSP